MNKEQIFPTVIIALSLGASVICAFKGDWHRATYWIAAAVLNASVTY
ncbi:MAG: hypothetical protein ACE14T_10145 [Syntrophales bacterium]